MFTRILGITLLFWLLCTSKTIHAQTPLNNKYEFRNGFYASLEDLKKDAPSYKLKSIPNFSYEADSEHNILILTESSLKALEQSPIGSVDRLWGICIKDEPYIKIRPKSDEAEVFFVKLHVLGKLSFFYYRTFKDVEIVMDIYNPYTGEKVAEKAITNREPILVEQLMDFETGELYPYTTDVFKTQIQGDSDLKETVDAMSQTELKEKMFKTLLIYNDRNPVYLPK
ncbi:MAG: hypothetical protein MK212_06705 [Saprospiraceae bacterium]|nr:hypothetical protein [Saprospiraceae bacterium]